MPCGTTTIRIRINAKDPQMLRQACDQVSREKHVAIRATQKGDIYISGTADYEALRDRVTQVYTGLLLTQQMQRGGYNVTAQTQGENIVLVATQ